MSDFAPGDRVRVLDGPFADFEAHVLAVDPAKQQLSVAVTANGRTVPIRTEPWQVRRLAQA